MAYALAKLNVKSVPVHGESEKCDGMATNGLANQIRSEVRQKDAFLG